MEYTTSEVRPRLLMQHMWQCSIFQSQCKVEKFRLVSQGEDLDQPQRFTMSVLSLLMQTLSLTTRLERRLKHFRILWNATITGTLLTLWTDFMIWRHLLNSDSPVVASRHRQRWRQRDGLFWSHMQWYDTLHLWGLLLRTAHTWQLWRLDNRSSSLKSCVMSRLICRDNHTAVKTLLWMKAVALANTRTDQSMLTWNWETPG